jgi:hypothetical protein
MRLWMSSSLRHPDTSSPFMLDSEAACPAPAKAVHPVRPLRGRGHVENSVYGPPAEGDEPRLQGLPREEAKGTGRGRRVAVDRKGEEEADGSKFEVRYDAAKQQCSGSPSELYNKYRETLI